MVTSKIPQRERVAVRTPPDGREGVASAQEWGPDLIPLDLKMPVMDGFGAAPRTHDAPFAAYPSNEEAGTQEQAVEDGIALVVSTAASDEDLLAALQAYLSAIETVSPHQEPLRIG